ncbi:MAG: prepilin-type N-terminal cleavage/methylation domain-containing protein [Actinomycetota bacterium]|nr:prepilin-type N-terminal cleavage/methylation domain-containing protein [Actinomycetota bacterium]
MVGRLTDDRGFSLTELITVTVLLGVVLAISYGAMIAVYRGTDVSDRQATISREAAAPLGAMEEIISQAISVDTANAYTMTVLTDRDNNKVIERHIFTANADGTLTQVTWLTNASRVNTTRIGDVTWSRNNRNVARTQPLFYYWDGQKPRARTTDPAQVGYVDMNLVVEVDGREYRDTRSVLLRNR